MSGEFGTGKTIFVLAIVVGCFAVLWPKIFYPMLTASVKQPSTGRQEGINPHARPERPAHLYPEMMHPALREKGRAMPQRTIDKQARPGPMPGVRPPMGGAGGIVPPPQQKGSGAMGIIMPLYTVGIVVFFVYTIMKVLFKKGQEDDKTPKLKDFGLDPEYRKYVFAEEYLDNSDVSSKDQMKRQAREESRSRKKHAQNETQQPETKIGGSGLLNQGRMDTKGKKLGEWYLPEGFLTQDDGESEDELLTEIIGGTTVEESAEESVRDRLFCQYHGKKRSKFSYEDIHCDEDIELMASFNKVQRHNTLITKQDSEQSVDEDDDDILGDEEDLKYLYSDEFFSLLKKSIKDYDPEGNLDGKTLEDVCKVARDRLKTKYIHHSLQSEEEEEVKEEAQEEEVEEEVQEEEVKEEAQEEEVEEECQEEEIEEEVQEEEVKEEAPEEEVEEECQEEEIEEEAQEEEVEEETQNHIKSRLAQEQSFLSKTGQSKEVLYYLEDVRLEEYRSPLTQKKMAVSNDIVSIPRGRSKSDFSEASDDDRPVNFLEFESEGEIDFCQEAQEDSRDDETSSGAQLEEMGCMEVDDTSEEQQGKTECEKKDEQLDQLRRRLEETEKAMERLMCQMGSVTDKLTAAKITEVLSQAQAQAKILKEEVGEMTSEDDVTSSEALTTTLSEDTSLPASLQRHLQEIQKNEDSPTSSKGSSPDMEEYEVITKDEDHTRAATKVKTSNGQTITAKSEPKKIQTPVKKTEEEEEEEDEEEIEEEEEVKEEEVEVENEEEEEEEEEEDEEIEEEEEVEEEKAEVNKKGNEPKRQTTETTPKAPTKETTTKTATKETVDDE